MASASDGVLATVDGGASWMEVWLALLGEVSDPGVQGEPGRHFSRCPAGEVSDPGVSTLTSGHFSKDTSPRRAGAGHHDTRSAYERHVTSDVRSLGKMRDTLRPVYCCCDAKAR